MIYRFEELPVLIAKTEHAYRLIQFHGRVGILRLRLQLITNEPLSSYAVQRFDKISALEKFTSDASLTTSRVISECVLW